MGPSKTPTKLEREWMDRIAEFGCVACIEDGHEYTVQIQQMPLREFEAMPEFGGW